MKKFFSKLGYLILSTLPGLLSILIQYAAAIGFVIVLAFAFSFSQAASGRPVGASGVMNQVMDTYMNSVVWIVFLYQLISLLVFVPWYYFVYGKKKRPVDREKPGVKGMIAIIAMGILFQFFFSGVLGVIDIVFPEALRSYQEMITQSGLVETSFLSIVCTAVLAPVGEELLCRGIILRLARKVSMRFWIANFIQAFVFGFIHLNLVQGCYAFVLGLMLGYIYGKYRNIFLCMLMHASLNASAFLVDIVWGPVPEDMAVAVLSFSALLCGILLVVCFLLQGKIKAVQGDGMDFPAVKQTS